MIRNFTLVLLILSCISSCGSSRLVPEANSPRKSQFSAEIDSIVVKKMREYQIPGIAIGVVSNGKVSYTQGYGVKSVKETGLVTANSVFHTASISKVFTAYAVMKLVSERKLQLDDPVADLIPGLKSSSENFKLVTIKNLLNHTSGVPDVSSYNWGDDNQAENALARYILDQDFKLKFEPGSSFSYSNLGYDLLGHIVEKTSNTAFQDYLKVNVLDPAGMQDSDFNYHSIADSLRVKPHTKHWLSKKVIPRAVYPYNIEHAPSSTLNSSANDMAEWMSSFFLALRSNTSNSIYSEMIQSSTEVTDFVGLGFQRYKIASKSAVGHYGGDRGFRSYLVMVPEEELGLVLLANCEFNEEFREEILHQILVLMLKEE